MTIRAKVVLAWQQLTKRERRIIRHKSIRAGVAVCRYRCKIIMALVQGKTPSQLAADGLCSASQVSWARTRLWSMSTRWTSCRRQAASVAEASRGPSHRSHAGAGSGAPSFPAGRPGDRREISHERGSLLGCGSSALES
jgi:hypothetical protein